MNKSAKIVSVMFLIAIYCFAITIINSPDKFGIKDSSSNTEQYLNTVTIGLHFNTLQLKNLIDGIEDFHTLTLKRTFNKFWLITKNIDQLINADYLQYFVTIRDFLIEYKKNKLIFPFHYHW